MLFAPVCICCCPSVRTWRLNDVACELSVASCQRLIKLPVAKDRNADEYCSRQTDIVLVWQAKDRKFAARQKEDLSSEQSGSSSSITEIRAGPYLEKFFFDCKDLFHARFLAAGTNIDSEVLTQSVQFVPLGGSKIETNYTSKKPTTTHFICVSTEIKLQLFYVLSYITQRIAFLLSTLHRSSRTMAVVCPCYPAHSHYALGCSVSMLSSTLASHCWL